MVTLTQIKYRDKQSWTTISGLQVNWTNYSTKIKDNGIIPFFLAPEEITGIWNGKQHDVQQIRWDAYNLQFYATESEIHDINRMRSCSDIVITTYNLDSSDNWMTKEYAVDATLNRPPGRSIPT